MPSPRHAARREHTGDRELEQMQRESARLAQRSNACPFLSGNLVKGLVFSGATPLTIDHGLGRAPQGFIVVRSYGTTAGPVPREATAQPPDMTRQIALEGLATFTTTYDIWFF